MNYQKLMPPSAQTIYVFITGDLFSFLKTRYWNLRDGTSFFLNTDEVNNFSEIYRNDDNFEITVFDVSTFFLHPNSFANLRAVLFPVKTATQLCPRQFSRYPRWNFQVKELLSLKLALSWLRKKNWYPLRYLINS